MRSLLKVLCFLCFPASGFCQGSSLDTGKISNTTILIEADNISAKSLSYIDKKYKMLSQSIEKENNKLLQSVKQKEILLQEKLSVIDSNKAKELFITSSAQYKELQNKIQTPVKDKIVKLKEYIPGIDSMNCAMKFLQRNKLDLNKSQLIQIDGINDNLAVLQRRLQESNEIQDFIRDREKQITVALENSPLYKDAIWFNKEVFYYQEKLKEYKALLTDKKKLEEKFISTVRNLPAFQNFMQKNSYLAQLFRMPGSPSNSQILNSLQTREQLQQTLSQRLGAPGQNPQQYVQQQIQSVQTSLDKLKDKLNQFGGGGSSDMTMPNFKPNEQKNKTFFQRLEYGFNIQNQRGSFLLPAISDLAVSLGYKIDSKKVIGIGASYKLGWGKGWDDISFTSEGAAIRSYVDIKAKGSIWITGGFECNYLQRFNNFSEIKNLEKWQNSALFGISKKYKIGKKLSGNLQLLYDFLAYRQIPQAQSLKFRFGYSF